MFAVFGSGLGPASLVQAGVFPLPTDLSGASVSVTVGGTTVDCFMVFTSAGQVAAILPSNTPTGAGTMTVTYNGSPTAPIAITVVPHSFGTFGINSAGSGPGVFTNATTASVNTITASAAPGELWDIWGTGLGAVPFADNDFPVVQDLGYNVRVFVGGVEAQVVYAGRSGCCSGVDQIRFVVPAGLSGCYLPVYVEVNGVPSNFTSMSVAAGGGACSDPGGITQTALSDGNLTVGIIPLQRVTTELNIPNLPRRAADDPHIDDRRGGQRQLLSLRRKSGDPPGVQGAVVYTGRLQCLSVPWRVRRFRRPRPADRSRRGSEHYNRRQSRNANAEPDLSRSVRRSAVELTTAVGGLG